MQYYKATRMNGRDFKTDTVDYGAALVSGEIVSHPRAKCSGKNMRMVRNCPDTYLSVSITPADCTAFQWPCRLFRVEPVGKVIGSPKYPLIASRDKRAVQALRVVEELPSWMAFGPNGEAVVAFIERFATTTDDEQDRLASNRKIPAPCDIAWGKAMSGRRYAAAIAARESIFENERVGTSHHAFISHIATCVAADTILALVVRDLLPKQFDALYGTWAKVMEA
jgi:hypothetical protein